MKINRSVQNTIKKIYASYIGSSNPDSIVTLSNSIEYLSSDIYSQNTRFIYELIQNADDSSSGKLVDISIKFIGKYLIVSHTGVPFSSRDIEGLCSVNHGTKKADNKSIGYKGIGFKSVFSQSVANVYVYTDGECFQFNKLLANKVAWNPEWGDLSAWEEENDREFKAPWQIIPLECELPSEISDESILNYNVSTVIELDDAIKTKREVSKLFEYVEFLLFLSNTSSITLDIGYSPKNYTKHQYDNGIIKLKKGGKILSYWWLHEKSECISQKVKEETLEDTNVPSKLKDADRLDITIAYKLKKTNETYFIEALKSHESRLYTYLPTEVTDFDFPFLVNTNFLVDASREKIKSNHIWNKWLFERIGYMQIESARDIMTKSFDISSNLTGIRQKFRPLDNDDLFSNFNEGMKSGLENVDFIYNKDAEPVNIRKVIVDKPNLQAKVPFFGSELNSFLMSEMNGFEVVNFINFDSENRGVLRKIGCEFFENEDLIKLAAYNDFAANLTPENAYCFIVLIMEKFSNFTKNSDLELKLSKTPLILTSNMKYVTIKESCEPGDSSEAAVFESNLDLIHDELFKYINGNKDLLNWLRRLGLQKMSPTAFLETKLLDSIESFVNGDNHYDVYLYLFNLFQSDLLNNVHFKRLNKLPLLCLDGDLHPANTCVFSENFYPKVNPRAFGEKVYELDDIYFKDKEFNLTKEFLVKVGIVDDLNLCERSFLSNDFDSEFLNYASERAKNGHKYPYLVSERWARDERESVKIHCFRYLPPFASDKKHLKAYWEQVFTLVTMNFLGTDKSKIGNTDENERPFSGERGWDRFSCSGKVDFCYDKMRWGRKQVNWVGIDSYVRYLVKNEELLPSISHGFQISSMLLLNSPKNHDLTLGLLPMIDAPYDLSEGWNKYLGLKESPTLKDFVQILTLLNTIEMSKKSLFDYVKLLYNEITLHLNNLDSWEEDLADVVDSIDTDIECFCLDGSFEVGATCIIEHSESISDSSGGLFFAPSNCIHDERFKALCLEVLGVRIASEVKLYPSESVENKIIKHRVISNTPYLMAYSECFIEQTEIEELIENLSRTRFYDCTSFSQQYVMDNEVIHEVEVVCGSSGHDFYSVIPFNSMSASKMTRHIAELMGLYDQESLVQSILTAEESLVKSTSIKKEALSWLNDFLDNPKYQSLLDLHSEKMPLVETEDIKASEIHKDYRPKSLDKETQILSSQQSILEAVNYLNNELRVGVDDSKKAIEKFVAERKITVNNGLIFHVRSAKRGTVYLSYTVWSDLSGVDSELMVFVSGSTEPRFFSTQQALIDACITERVSIEMEHEGDVNRIEDMFSGEFARRPYSEIPSTHLAFELSSNIQVSTFEAGVFQEYLDEDLNGGVLDELS